MANVSPSFRNVKLRQARSPLEIREKIRKSYRDKVQLNRSSLVNRLRQTGDENDLRDKLSLMLHDTHQSDEQIDLVLDDELQTMHDIAQELISVELQWLVTECEKSDAADEHLISLMDQNDVICPVCLKQSLTFGYQLRAKHVKCDACGWMIPATKTLADIQIEITQIMNNHADHCSSTPHFQILSDSKDNHLYFLCSTCSDMQIVL